MEEPGITHTRGGARVYSKRKIGERYVGGNVDTSRVSPDNKAYILDLCDAIMQFDDRVPNLYFKIKDDNSHYTICVCNWDAKFSIPAWTEHFHLQDAQELFQGIIDTKLNPVTGQLEVMVKKQGIVSSMRANRKKRIVESPYGPSSASVRPDPTSIHRHKAGVGKRPATMRVPTRRPDATRPPMHTPRATPRSARVPTVRPRTGRATRRP